MPDMPFQYWPDRTRKTLDNLKQVFYNGAMMKLTQIPDPILRVTAVTISDFTTMTQTFVDMVEVARENNLVGLASNQVSRVGRFFIVEIDGAFRMFVNPMLYHKAEMGTEFKWEGCGSIPSINCLVKRSKQISVTACDENGKEFTEKFSGKVARAIQHENDHLNGVLITDKARETMKV